MGGANRYDTGWGFPPQFYHQGQEVGLVSEAEDIKQSLQILFGTAIRERLNHPDYGCDLKKFMFEEVDYTLVKEIQQMILDSIYMYEPRVEVQNVAVTEADLDAHQLLINIDYTIAATQSNQSLVFPLALYS